jgi:hypothetical protein
MASKKTVEKTAKKESAKKSVKSTGKASKAVKAASVSKKSRRSKVDDDDSTDLIPSMADEENAPDEVLLDEGIEAEEREASRLDLEEVAKQADRIENQQPADGEGEDKEDI